MTNDPVFVCCNLPHYGHCDVYITEPPKGRTHKENTIRKIYRMYPSQWVRVEVCKTFFKNVYSVPRNVTGDYLVDQPTTNH